MVLLRLPADAELGVDPFVILLVEVLVGTGPVFQGAVAVDDPHGVVHHAEAQGDQCVDRPAGQSGEYELEEVLARHRSPKINSLDTRDNSEETP